MVRTLDDVKRAEITQAAGKLFLSNGFKKTSVEDIAQEAGVAKGTVYLYFKTKQDMLVRLGVDYLNEARESLIRDLESEQDISRKMRRALALRAERIYKFIELYPHALDILMTLSKEAADEQGAGQFYQDYMVLLKSIILEGIESGRFRQIEDLDEYVFNICFMTQAFQPPYKIVNNLPDLLKRVDWFADTLLTAIEL